MLPEYNFYDQHLVHWREKDLLEELKRARCEVRTLGVSAALSYKWVRCEKEKRIVDFC